MKVGYLNKISPLGLNTFTSKYEIIDDPNGADLLLVRSFNMHEMPIENNLLAVARAGAGVNNIPLEKMAENGVVVFNTPGANSNGVKELVIAGMLMASRDLIGGVEWVKNNKADIDILKSIEKAKSAFAGNEIIGKTMLVIGLGAIGGKVANACDALGLKVIGYDPYISDEAKSLLNPSIEINNILEETYPHADFISLHLPLLDSTKQMINETVFKQMKKGVVLLNFARDLLVDDEALKDAIDQGIVKKYVTDFPSYFVANLSNVIAFPHLGASTDESEENCAIMAAKQLMAYIEKGEIINSVNYPNVKLDSLTVKSRVIILAKNDPSIAREIAKVFLEVEDDIKAKTSKVRADYAFYAFDIDQVVKPNIIEALENIEGITRVRVI
ncbi:MAG: 3-phosphoglycerate dehydrogenase family protein [Candidatus Izemoplasmatales bacterium]|jgi:D-3-phosphoglycerate dehydrogenase|nr:3-phosphoglycerate dehydrogenase family protein [Candidatus Izemoplasmatales bacterium]